MKVLTATYRHTEKRTVNYQSVESSIEATAAVDEGETASEVVKALRQGVRKMVRDDVTNAINEITSAGSAPSASTAPAVAAAGTGTAGRWGTPSKGKAN